MEHRATYSTDLSRWDESDIEAAAAHAERLLASQGWQLISDLAKSQEEKQIQRMLGPQLLSHQQYVHVGGVVEGIRQVLEAPAAIIAVNKRRLAELARREEDGHGGV